MNYDWLMGDAVELAPQLLGYTLIHHTPSGDVGGIIVETEAYRARDDASSHAHNRAPTARTTPMFMAGGTVYVYFTYGMHHCLNITTGPEGEAQAILIRALEPTLGLAQIHASRPTKTPDYRLASGPGSLCRALGIDKSLSGSRFGCTLELLPPAKPINPSLISAGPRIGIKIAAELPWRFWLTGHPSVSR